jgi:hypothetical protein
MVLSISEEEFLEMKGVVLDGDKSEAFKLIKKLVERLEQQARQGVKSHI